jgi:hypothetical protein
MPSGSTSRHAARRVPALFVVVHVFAAAAACQSVLSIDGPVAVRTPDDASAPDEAGPRCGFAPATGACEACVEGSCCAQAQACAANPACAEYEACLVPCAGDYACRMRCLLDHPIGDVQEAAALDQCVVTGCEAPCAIACGLTQSFCEPPSATACQRCIEANVCSTGEACGDDLQCQQADRCARSCVTRDCQIACLDESGPGGTRYFSLLLGLAGSCLTECDVGNYWECVGKVNWPVAKGRTLALTLTLFDGATGKTVSGAAVKACRIDDPSCAAPMAQSTTDGGGLATIDLPPLGGAIYGFDGYLEIAPTAAAPDVMPYLFFMPAPLSEPNAKLFAGVYTRPELENMVSAVGASLDPARGHVHVVARDCFLNSTSGAAVAAAGTDAKTLERYLSNNLLSASATATDKSGTALFLNAPTTQPIEVTILPRATGHVSSRASVFVRAGAVSLVDLSPTPQ